MKLEKYVDKNAKRRKTIIISLGVIVLISVSFLLYKSFASFTENAEFPMMKGKVDYFGNSDIYFAFYKGDEQLDEMPQKGNKENLVFEHGECDNGASIEWNSEEWGPVVKNLSKNKTKCSLYFKEQKEIVLGKDILTVESGDGLYAVPHDDLEELGQEWNQTEYRYAGVDPANYVLFNNEIWRIIGLVNVKTDSGVEQRLKIVRQDGIKSQKDFGNYAWNSIGNNNWSRSTLKDMLNGVYYESLTGDCYTGSIYDVALQDTCDFNTGIELPKGLDDKARVMIDKEVIWNLGGWGNATFNNVTVKMFYERERGTSTGYSTYPYEWSVETDAGGKHNGIGLIYLSDFGYAVGGEVRNNCLTNNLYDYKEGNCATSDWLTPSNNIWTLTQYSYESYTVFDVNYNGKVSVDDGDGVINAYGVWPTLYLTTSTKIVDGTGDINSPFVLSLN